MNYPIIRLENIRMEKLKFFKGLFFGLLMSAFMWSGIIYTILKIDKVKFQPAVSDVKAPVAANLIVALLDIR